MGRKIREANLESIGNRAKLGRGEYHWRAVSQGRHIGYRRPEKEGGAGVWFARVIWKDDRGKHVIRKERLGIADDHLDADGVDILTFAQAQERAAVVFPKLFSGLHGEDRQHSSKTPYTLNMACDDYLHDFEMRGAKSLDRTKDVIRCHIKPALGEIELSRLRQKTIEAWLHGIATSGRKVRARNGVESRVEAVPEDQDGKRARKATANRIWNVLRAILNFALHRRKIDSDDAWSRVKAFRAVDSARDRFLSPEEQVRLVNGADPDFRQLLCGGIHTGCRYGELIQLRVRDVNLQNGTLFLPDTKSGHARHVPLAARGIEFFGGMVAGRKPEEILFIRANGKPWGRSDQQRPMARTCAAASIESITFYEASRHSYAAQLVRLGVPLHVVAKALGHSDTRMVIKHYGHLAPDYISKEIRERTDGIALDQ